MTDNIKYSLYKDSDAIDASILRSILLFDKEGIKTTDLVEKAIFAILLEQADNEITEGVLLQLFNERFQERFDWNEIHRYVESLKNRGYIDNHLRVSADFGKNQFDAIDLLTGSFFDRIVSKVADLTIVSSSDKEQMKKQIRKALSVYFKMYGYEFFGLQEHSKEEEAKEAIKIAREGLRPDVGEALVRILAITISEPSDEDKIVLRIWAKAFVASQIMKIDPTLKLFKAEQLKSKHFLLDTDVVLHCLTENTEKSILYRKMLERLRLIGCSIYIDKRVVKEVRNHADAAISIYNRYKESIKELPNEVLQEISNVFIDDYVQTIRKDLGKSSMPFKVYIGNHYNKWDDEVLSDCMSAVFGEDVLKNAITLSIDENSEPFISLSEKIYEYTSATYKGAFRSDELNKEMSNLDAYLFLIARHFNEDVKGKRFLSGRAYVVTTSTRAIRSAKDIGLSQVDVVCNPSAIISFLGETDGFSVGDDVQIINLFENPFLSYLAQSMWDDIQVLLNKGNLLRFKELQQLRTDYRHQVHSILTSKASDDEIKQKLRDHNFVFIDDFESLKKEISEKDERIAKLEKAALDYEKRIKDLNTQKARTGNQSVQRKRNKRRKP